MLKKKCAFLLATTSIPTSIVDNEEFPDFISTLDPRFELFGRTSMVNEIKSLHELGKKILKTRLGRQNGK